MTKQQNQEKLRSAPRVFELFPEPIVDYMKPSGIRGLEIWSIYDRSQEAEDPLNPTLLLVNQQGKVFELGLGTIDPALKSIGFDPKNEGEVMAAAKLVFSDNGYVVFDGKPVNPGLPKDVFAKVASPSFERIAKGWKVRFYVYFRDYDLEWHDQEYRYLAFVTTEVGKGHYRSGSTTIWNEGTLVPK